MNDSTQAVPDGNFARAWLENLGSGLKLCFFRDPGALRLHASASQFIALAATSLAVSGASSFLQSGADGVFNPQALPSELLWVPLALLAGYLVGRVMKDERYALLVPIAVGSISIALTVAASVVWLSLDREWIKVPASVGMAGVYRVLFVWWALAIWVAVRRLTNAVSRRSFSPAWIVALIVLLPAHFLPPEPLWDVNSYPNGPVAGSESRFDEHALYAQADLLRTAEQRLKPERAGVADLYFVGFAPSAAQDVFMKETLAIGRLMEDRFGVAGRAISLISHPAVIDQYPIATLTSLRHALHAVGEHINHDEDVVLLHLTSHGSENHLLSVEFFPLDLQPIAPHDVRAALDEAGIIWRIVVISACYSGGFIEALKDDRTMVVTASDARHTSFGCGNAFDFTYFSKAYFDEALRQTYSFEKAFAIARQAVALREQKEGLEPSGPQMALGNSMKAKLATLEERLAAEAANAK
jgi:hypothetical protein